MKIIRNGGEALFSDVVCADTFARRFLGLMPRRELKPSEGLLLTDCGRIHTNFMRFTISSITNSFACHLCYSYISDGARSVCPLLA